MYPSVLKRFSEPISVVATISKQPIDIRQAAQKCPYADVIADLTGRDKQIKWATLAVANGVV